MARQNPFFRAQNRDRGTDFYKLKVTVDDFNIHYFEDENTIACLGMFQPVSGWNKELGTAWVNTLNMDYPDDTMLQVIELNHPYNEPKFQSYENARINVTGDKSVQVAVQNAFKRAEFLRRGVKQPLIPTSDAQILQSVCFLTIKIPLKAKNPLKADSAGKEKFVQECEKFSRLYKNVIAQLKTGGIHINILNRQESIAVLRRYFQMEGEWDNSYNENEFFNDQLFPTASQVNWSEEDTQFVRMSGFGLMDQKQSVGILSVGRYPDKEHPWHMAQMNELLGHPGGDMPQPGMPFALTTTIYYPNQTVKKAAIKRSHVIATRSDNKVNRKYSTTLAPRLQGYKQINDSMGKGGKPVEVCTSLMLFHEDENRIEDTMMKMQTYYASKGFMMYPERLIPCVSFVNNLPMGPSAEHIKKTYRFKTQTTLEAAHLLPVFDEWQGFGNGMLLNTRRGKLFSYEIYSKANTNYNVLVCGEAGGGKTVAVQHFTDNELSLGTKVYTLDSGSNYMASGELKGAAIIDIHNESDLDINPFTKIKDFNTESPALVPILGKMAKPKEGLDDFENALVADALAAVWTKEGNKMNIDSIVKFLYDQNGPHAPIQHKLARLLGQFTSDKPNGRWFNGTNNFRSDADWTIIELSGFGENEHLREVMLMMFTSVIKQDMFVNRDSRKKMVVIGEAGDHLDNPSMAQFLSRLTAKNRKEDGICLIEVQNMQQVHATHYGKIIMGNCFTHIFMHQTSDALEHAKKEGWLDANPYVIDMMKGMKILKGYFSEFCIISGGKNATVVRLVETPENRIIYNTEGPVFKELQRRVRAGEPIEDYIREQAEAKYGVAA